MTISEIKVAENVMVNSFFTIMGVILLMSVFWSILRLIQRKGADKDVVAYHFAMSMLVGISVAMIGSTFAAYAPFMSEPTNFAITAHKTSGSF